MMQTINKTARIAFKDILEAKAEFEKIDIGPEEAYKLVKLMDTPHLRELFQDLVESGQISEEEFWSTAVDIKQFKMKEKEYFMENGVSNKRMIISNEYFRDTNSSEICLQKSDAIRLLNDYPNISLLHSKHVTDKENSEKEFWEYILKKNFEYRTEIFGGSNPEYIGFSEQEEKLYEDRFLNNIKTSASMYITNSDAIMQPVDENDNTEILNKLRAIKGSVNIIMNSDFDPKPEDLDWYVNDLNEEKKGKKNEKISEKTEKLINKYNKNSERILLKNTNEEVTEKAYITDFSKMKIKSTEGKFFRFL